MEIKNDVRGNRAARVACLRLSLRVAAVAIATFMALASNEAFAQAIIASINGDPITNIDIDERTFIRLRRGIRDGKVERDKLPVAVGLAGEGVPWGRQETANVIFLFAVPLSEAGKYLLLLSGLSRLMQNEAALAALQAGTQPEEMWRVLNEIRLPG